MINGSDVNLALEVPKMKKFFFIILTTLLFITGCQAGGTPSDDTDTATVQDDGSVPDVLEGLTLNEYDGLEFTVNVLERKAILPGTPFVATVTIENKGDQTISYIQGSGSFTIPEAVFLYSGNLQTVIPQDHLGIATADFVTHDLKPGESLMFKLDAMAIEPHPDFRAYTFEMFDEQVYIADMDWTDLQGRFPELVPAQPGNYMLKAYFLYSIADENAQFAALTGPTGYAVAETVIGVS